MTQAVLTDFKGSLWADLRVEDPPADVPAMKVQLRPGPRPVEARARRGGPEKAIFKNHVPPLSLLGW